MDEEMIKRKQELEMLIESKRQFAKRNCLSQKGLNNLEGMKEAYDIMFPIQIQG